MASSNIDNILERMRNKVLTRIQGEPSFETLEQFQKELRANAKAIHSTVVQWATGKTIEEMILTVHEMTSLSPMAASNEAEVRQAYRTIIRAVHPDKVRTSSVSEKLKAQEVFAVFNEAYEQYRNRE